MSDYKRWVPIDPAAVFLLVHGLGAHAGRWEAAGFFFANRGIASYAAELGGHESFEAYYGAVMDVYDIAARANPAKKIFIVGESMGAVISFLLASDKPELFGGLICLSPAFGNRHKPSPVEFLKMLAPLLYAPAKKIKLPFDSATCTRDADYRRKMDEDPREYRSISSRLILEILCAQRRAGAAGSRIEMPVLVLVAGNDRIADPAVTRKVFGALAARDKTIVDFPEMYHSLSIDTGKEAVFEAISEWVIRHCEPRRGEAI